MLSLNPNTDGGHSLSRKGNDTKKFILETALEVLIAHGYGEFSIQKVAQHCGMSRGNVSYYYPTRSSLLSGLLEAVIKGYIEEFDRVVIDERRSPEEKFVKIIEFIMDDLTTEETSKFFPELWALANRNEDAERQMRVIYEQARAHITSLLAELNPALGEEERTLVGLFISASIEGQTPFVGHGRQFEKDIAPITRIAAYSFLTLAKTITAREIHDVIGATSTPKERRLGVLRDARRSK